MTASRPNTATPADARPAATPVPTPHMNLIAKLLPLQNVMLDLEVASKKRVFEQVGLLFENNHPIARSHVTTEAGGAASSTAIRALIKQLVAAENARKPLSDGQLSEILSQQGIMVARRTVAKYRELLQILPANLRKSF